MLFLNIRGNVSINFNESPLLSIVFKDEIIIDVLNTSFFDLIESDHQKGSEISFWDLIHDARDFADKLKEHNLTVVLNIKGKETLIIGEKAKPSFSQLLSKSKNIQIKSVIETAKLSKEILD